MIIEALIQPMSHETNFADEIAVEAWSRTVVRTSLFTTTLSTRVWDMKPGEEWRAYPDESSQADFKINPRHRLAFPDQIIRATAADGSAIEVRDGEVVNNNDEPIVVTIVGVRLQVDRTPDEKSAPFAQVDIDNWR